MRHAAKGYYATFELLQIIPATGFRAVHCGANGEHFEDAVDVLALAKITVKPCRGTRGREEAPYTDIVAVRYEPGCGWEVLEQCVTFSGMLRPGEELAGYECWACRNAPRKDSPLDDA